MNALLDAVRTQSPCARRLLRQYSTSIVERVPWRGSDRRIIGDMRRDLGEEEANEEALGGGKANDADDADSRRFFEQVFSQASKNPYSNKKTRGVRDTTKRGRSSSSRAVPENDFPEDDTRDRWGGKPLVVREKGVSDDAPWANDMYHPAAVNKFARKGDHAAGRHIKVVGPEQRKKYGRFGQLIYSRLREVVQELGPWSASHSVYQSLGVQDEGDLARKIGFFKSRVARSLRDATDHGHVSRADNPLFWNLRNAFVRGDTAGLNRELRYALQSSMLAGHVPAAVAILQQNIADFRYPYEWYPATRTMQRTVHLHVGPTNSGKTYRALQALEKARTGIYAGPLRLLAHEIYSRFQAKGKPCALITGEEQRFPDVGVEGGAEGTSGSDGGSTTTTPPANGEYFQSCTVEMTPLNKRVDVAVIDEIQMIADPERGWAWTQAFLGVQAREVHLCGEERAVDLIEELCGRIGDRCVVHRYERLSGLRTAWESLGGDFRNLQKGDAVVSFSRVGLHTLKAGIEKLTGRRCAIVYGSLPPETRAQQAALFNDPDNDYDFLVASDAIGMGLNLEIKRVVFEMATKHDGLALRPLTVPEIKQIGGRAGRYRTASRPDGDGAVGEAGKAGDAEPTGGVVTTMEGVDLPLVQKAFQAEAPPLTAAGIQPPTFAIERFARYFPAATPFSFVLQRLRQLARVATRFQLCTPKESIDVADIIQPYALSIADRCIFISAPVALRDPGQREVLAALARCVAEMRGGHLLDIAAINLEVLDFTRDTYPLGPSQYLYRLEALHKAITLYLWLSYRYVGVFVSQALAFHVKTMVEDKITEYLEGLTFVAERRQQRAQTLRKKAEKAGQRRGVAVGDDGVGDDLDIGAVDEAVDIAVDKAILDAVTAEAQAADRTDKTLSP